MLEAIRSPRGRIVFGLAASAVLVAMILVVNAGMFAMAPALLVPIWVALFAGDHGDVNPRVLRGLLIAGTATFLLGVLAFVALS